MHDGFLKIGVSQSTVTTRCLKLSCLKECVPFKVLAVPRMKQDLIEIFKPWVRVAVPDRIETFSPSIEMGLSIR
jgi:hypothetical protein